MSPETKLNKCYDKSAPASKKVVEMQKKVEYEKQRRVLAEKELRKLKSK